MPAHAPRELRKLAPELWVAEQPLRVAGVELGARMTVVRLHGAQLVLHSPIARTPALAEQVERLGTPAFLVAPNRLHHLYVQEWATAYPDARLLLAPGLETKRTDLAPRAAIIGERPAEWGDVLDQTHLDGAPFLGEVVLFHRPSATLIATDLLFNVGAESPPLTRLLFRVAGAYGRPAVTPLERLLVRDRDAFRRSLTRVLEWPFERVVLAHGAVIERGGREALAAAYAWLLGEPAHHATTP